MNNGVRYISETAQLENGMLDILECVKSIEDMFLLFKNGDYMMGGKNHLSHGLSIHFSRGEEKNENLYIAMPAYLGGRFNYAGLKWHGPNVKGVINTPLGLAETCYTLLLNEPNTGARKAIIPANTVTTYRTAAVSVCAAKYLSKNNPETICIVGPGKINTLITEGLVKLFPSISTIKVKGHSTSGIDRFESTIKGMFPSINIVRCESIQEAVVNSDIVAINTGFAFDSIKDMPILRDNWIKNDSLILSMSFIKVPNNTLFNNSYKVVDTLKMYEAYIDEYGYPSYSRLSILGNSIADGVYAGKISKDEVIEIADIISGSKSIKHDGKPILFASGGLGIEDIAVGVDLLHKAEEKNIGIILEN